MARSSDQDSELVKALIDLGDVEAVDPLVKIFFSAMRAAGGRINVICRMDRYARFCDVPKFDPIGKHLGLSYRMTDDPCHRLMREGRIWFEMSDIRRSIDRSKRQRPWRRVFQDWAAADVEDGVCIPYFGANGFTSRVVIGGIAWRRIHPGRRAILIALARSVQSKLCEIAHRLAPPGDGLSRRERDCLELVAAGRTDREIAALLGIGSTTVHGYVADAMAKLGTTTRAQAVIEAITIGQLSGAGRG